MSRMLQHNRGLDTPHAGDAGHPKSASFRGVAKMGAQGFRAWKERRRLAGTDTTEHPNPLQSHGVNRRHQ